MGKETIIEDLDYGLLVKDGANPEVEIYILGSYGQSGHCSLVIVLMAVDGGISGVPAVVCNIPYGKKKDIEIPSEIRKCLNKLHQKFIQDCPFLNEEDICNIILRWNKLTEGEEKIYQEETNRVGGGDTGLFCGVIPPTK